MKESPTSCSRSLFFSLSRMFSSRSDLYSLIMSALDLVLGVLTSSSNAGIPFLASTDFFFSTLLTPVASTATGGMLLAAFEKLAACVSFLNSFIAVPSFDLPYTCPCPCPCPPPLKARPLLPLGLSSRTVRPEAAGVLTQKPCPPLTCP